ncbi:hypothetical protein [Streptomyces sp. NEAU-W12]|uniref:hypothetical protein n=1 Tax=Streptomyces sp. NEAU-W12 TaxID=2994668 RepID=UPI00224AFA6A|nr:hypothetical protein [Streptomyces sp. NEAU-W12]MCX2925674.1 hypothetical protein [Streptomyces sp. NEAU-W12]
MRTFTATGAGSTGLLPAAVAVALAWTNSPWSEAHTSLWHTGPWISPGGARLSMDLGTGATTG